MKKYILLIFLCANSAFCKALMLSLESIQNKNLSQICKSEPACKIISSNNMADPEKFKIDPIGQFQVIISYKSLSVKVEYQKLSRIYKVNQRTVNLNDYSTSESLLSSILKLLPANKQSERFNLLIEKAQAQDYPYPTVALGVAVMRFFQSHDADTTCKTSLDLVNSCKTFGAEILEANRKITESSMPTGVEKLKLERDYLRGLQLVAGSAQVSEAFLKIPMSAKKIEDINACVCNSAVCKTKSDGSKETLLELINTCKTNLEKSRKDLAMSAKVTQRVEDLTNKISDLEASLKLESKTADKPVDNTKPSNNLHYPMDPYQNNSR